MPTPILSPDDLLLIQSLRHKKEAIHEKVAVLKEEIARLSSGLPHIEAIITLLLGDKIKQKRHRSSQTFYFKGGEGKKHCLDVLRGANSPIDTGKVTLAVIHRAGFDKETLDFKSFQKSILNILKGLESRGLIKVARREGMGFLWEVV